MKTKLNIARLAALTATLITLAGCASTGGLGSVLESVLGGTGAAAPQQLAGTVRGVDTQNSQISVQQSNGQTIPVLFDQNTKVVYQNRLYQVTSLDPGDQINARVQTTQNSAYYTDSIAVTVPVSTSGTSTGTTSESVQSLQGTVRSIDRNTGKFTIDAGSNVVITVSMPYRATSTDAIKYNNLRVGNFIRFTGVYLNSSLVELRQFQ